MANWYIIYNGQQVGPVAAEQLSGYGLNAQSKVWREGLSDWVEAYTQPELMELIGQSAPASASAGAPASGYVAPASARAPEKTNTVAGILTLLLGGFGAQYFYIGKPGAAIVTILLYWFTCGIWSIVLIIQGVKMLTMSQQEFEEKYVNSSSFMPLF